MPVVGSILDFRRQRAVQESGTWDRTAIGLSDGGSPGSPFCGICEDRRGGDSSYKAGKVLIQPHRRQGSLDVLDFSIASSGEGRCRNCAVTKRVAESHWFRS